MAKRNTTKAPQVEAEVEDDDEAELMLDAPRSVVKSTYKHRYAERAAQGVKGASALPAKARKRSTLDWLAIELGKRVLDDRARLVVPQLEAILSANGVNHERWNRTTRGWEGRLRMSGRLALQRIVAETGVLVVPGEGDIAAPRAWVQKHTH